MNNDWGIAAKYFGMLQSLFYLQNKTKKNVSYSK